MCIRSRQAYYSSELNLAAFNSTEIDFQDLQAQYVSELQTLVLPYEEACQEEERVLIEWQDKKAVL